jgi:hypothetical protein
MLLNMLILGVLLPCVVSFILVMMLWRGQSPDRRWRPLWVPALALTIAFLAGWYFLKGLPRWPAPDSAGWLPWLALGGGLIGIVIATQKFPPFSTFPLRLLASIASIWLATQSLQRNTWQEQSWLWIGGLSLLLVLLWSIWEDLANKHEGAIVPLLLTVNFSALAIATLLVGSAIISQNAGIVCAALGAMVIAGMIRPSLNISGALPFVAMPLYAVLLINAHFYSGLDLLHTGLVLACTFAAPLAVQATAKHKLLPKLTLAALICALPFLVSLGMLLSSPSVPAAGDSADDYYDDYYGR